MAGGRTLSGHFPGASGKTNNFTEERTMTVQEIQEIGFEKAVFGGYDMKSVDTFLERVAESSLPCRRKMPL